MAVQNLVKIRLPRYYSPLGSGCVFRLRLPREAYVGLLILG
jgi:hypothetical protein